MKNKVKLWGIIMLVLITLFCFTFTACNNDDDGNGTIGNGNGTNGGGGGGGGGGPVTPPLSGQVFINPPSGTIGTELTASYIGGSENVSFQWNRNGTAIAGATGDKYIIQQTGTYTVTASASGFTSKTSNSVVVPETGQAPNVPGFSVKNTLRINPTFTEITFDTKTFTGDSVGGGLGNLPIAKYFTITNTSNTPISNLNIRVVGSDFRLDGRMVQGNQQLTGADGWQFDYTYPDTLADNNGTTRSIAIQPTTQNPNHPLLGLVPKTRYYNMLVISYPADPEDILLVDLYWDLKKGTGQPVRHTDDLRSAWVTPAKNSLTIDATKLTNATDPVTQQVLEYTITSYDFGSTVPDHLNWITVDDKLTINPLDPNDPGVPDIGANSGEIVFDGLPENKPYIIWSRYRDNVYYNAGPVKRRSDTVIAPLTISTTN